MPPFRRETQEEMKERLEKLAKWRRETGRDVKPDKPWLPLRRRAMTPAVAAGLPNATAPAKSLATQTAKASSGAHDDRTNSTNLPSRDTKRKIQPPTKANAAQVPDKRLKLVGKENKDGHLEKGQIEPTVKSRRELLDEWKKSRQAIIAESKKQEHVDKQLATRRQTISSGFKFPSSLASTSSQQPTLLPPASKVNLRRQTMVVSHRMSPLLKKANAKDVSLDTVAAGSQKKSTIRPVVPIKKLTVPREPNFGSSKPATVSRSAKVNAQPDVPRRSISTLHRASVAAVAVRPSTAATVRQSALKSTKTESFVLPSKQAGNQVQKKKQIIELSKVQKANAVKHGSSVSVIKKAKATVVITPPASAKERSSLGARKSVTFHLSPGNGVTPQNSPSLRNRLEYWLAARGKTTSRFRHLHCFGVEMSATKHKRMPTSATPGINMSSRSPLSVVNRNLEQNQQQQFGESPELTPQPSTKSCINFDSTSESSESSQGLPILQEVEGEDVEEEVGEEVEEERGEDKGGKQHELAKLAAALADLLELHERNYPVQGISDWLDEMYVAQPDVQRLSAYWICRAKMSEKSGHPREVVSLLSRGISMGAQPLAPLISHREKHTRFSRITKHVDASNLFDSTKIQYALMDRPPLYCGTFKELPAKSPAMVYVTPVRRSRRLSHNNIINDDESFNNLSTPFKSGSAKRSIEVVQSIDELPKGYCGRRSLFLLANPALSEEPLE